MIDEGISLHGFVLWAIFRVLSLCIGWESNIRASTMINSNVFVDTQKN